MPARKYFLIDKICLHCGIQFQCASGGQNERIFCSKLCSNSHRKPSEEAKEKISNTLTKFFQEKNVNNDSYICANNIMYIECLHCKKLFPFYNKKLKFCSKVCSSSHHVHSQETKDKMRNSQIQLIENDNHIGWRSSSRKNKQPSYPEQYVIEILNNSNIEYEREFKVKRWFIDFADVNRRLALEIDGKQHDLPKRQASDKLKDQFLIDNEWKILRIRWEKVSKNFREELINQIVNFFKKE